MSAWMPLRLQEAPNTPQEQLADTERRLQRIKLIAEGAEAQLAELSGVEVSLDLVLEVLGMSIEQVEEIRAPDLGRAPLANGGAA